MTGSDAPLVLHALHHLVIGGMENGLINLINHLPAERYRHAVLCIEDFDDFRDRIQSPDVEVIPLHRSRIGVWRMRREIYRICRRMRPSIVHSRNLSGLDAIVPARLAGVPHVVHSEHGWDIGDLDGSNRKSALLRRAHVPFVSRYVAVSKHLGEYLANRVRVPRSRLSRVCNGVDTERFRPGASAADCLPAGFAGDGKLVIGTVGRAQAVKDQATLIKAFAKLLRRSDAARLRLVIVGDGPMLEDLRRLVLELGVAENCWLPGSSDRIPELLRAMHVFVLPSLAEGISNTVLEAMASGLPVIGSDVGGTPELIETGRQGFLFPAGDADVLAELLARYEASDALRREHGDAARDRAVAEFSLVSMVGGYGSIYDELTSSR